MGNLTPGTQVHVDPFGDGRVIRVMGSGCLVELDKAKIRVQAPLYKVRQLEEPRGADASARDRVQNDTGSVRLAKDPVQELVQPVPQPATAKLAVDAMPSDRLNALRSIEALRFGIVPVQSIKHLTEGLDALKGWVDSRLSRAGNPRPEVAEVYGAFGTGKSHTMAAVRLLAQEAGWLTAWVEVDGDLVSLSDPAKLLSQLWPTLSAPDFDSPTPVSTLYRRAIERSAQDRPGRLIPFEPVFSNFVAFANTKRHFNIGDFEARFEGLLSDCEPVGRLAADIRRAVSIGGSYTMGGSTVPRRMIASRVADRPQDLVNCLLGHAIVASLAGFRGLVVTIDEFEVEHNYATRFGRVAEVLTAMAQAFGTPDVGSQGLPLALFIATVGHSGEAGDSQVQALVSATGGSRYPVHPLDAEARKSLAQKIHTLYQQAYLLAEPFAPPLVARVERAIADPDVYESALVRAFVKRYVAELDARHGPKVS